LYYRRKIRRLLGRRYNPFSSRHTTVRKERRDLGVGRRVGGVYKVD